jgi:predicted ATP-grasp superfamily ATP-dependent carboligase
VTTERILLLDGQTTQALACARSLGRAGHEVFAASVSARPLAGWSRFCTARYRLSSETPAAYAELREWARGRGVTIVLPLTERSHLLLAPQRTEWEEARMVVGCADEAILRRAFDKASTLAFAERSNVPVPPTRLPRSLEETRAAGAALGFPCVVKSRFSCVWSGTTLVRDGGTSYVRSMPELEAAVLRHRQGEHWPIVQRYVPGEGRGVFTVCDRGRPLAWFAHERLRDVRPTGSGSSLRRSVPLDPRLCEPAARLLAAMEWRGPAMVEFRDDGVEEPRLMEVNGRFWGSLQLAIAAGVDFPRLWVAVLRQRPVAVPTAFRAGVTLRWLWGDAKRLLYVLAGPPAGYPGRFPTRWKGVRELIGAQPIGTRIESWDRGDPWPAVGEWVQGLEELLTHRRAARRRANSGRVPWTRPHPSAS